jgi:hypothetical protein
MAPHLGQQIGSKPPWPSIGPRQAASAGSHAQRESPGLPIDSAYPISKLIEGMGGTPIQRPMLSKAELRRIRSERNDRRFYAIEV